MRSLYIYLVIMFLASYLPRVIPLVAMKGKDINSKYIKSFLFYVPYAVLGSMTFPAIFYSTGNKITALIGTVIAIILSYYKKGLTKVALAAVLAVYLSSFLFE